MEGEVTVDREFMQDMARNAVPKWWQSRKGTVAVIVLGGYALALLFQREMPQEYAELARIVVVALFLTANGEHGRGGTDVST